MGANDLTIVKLESGHLEECAEIMAGSDPWITLGCTRKEARASFERYLLSERCSVAVLGGKVIGFIVFYVEEAFPLGGYVKGIGVHEHYRRRGIGRRLMEFVEEKILNQWPNVFLLVSDFNTAAQCFYRKLGYSEVGRIQDALVRGRAELIYRKTAGPLERVSSS